MNNDHRRVTRTGGEIKIIKNNKKKSGKCELIKVAFIIKVFSSSVVITCLPDILQQTKFDISYDYNQLSNCVLCRNNIFYCVLLKKTTFCQYEERFFNHACLQIVSLEKKMHL